MTWTMETSQGYESDKIATHVVPYTRGRGLDIGCGMRKVWPHVIGIDNLHHFGHQSACDIQGDGSDLSIFSDETMNFVFSSHTLEHFPRERVPTILAEWARTLKDGGYLCLYVPSANLYPKCEVAEPSERDIMDGKYMRLPDGRCIEYGCNTDHKWDIYPGDIAKILTECTPHGWEQVECEERSMFNEYSLFEVYKKKAKEPPGIVKNVWQRNPEGKKRVLVIRYGAIGDQIVAASILPGLKAQGYHVTYNSTPESAEVVKHDPHIDDFLLQDKDQVPNPQLGPYWEQLAQRYDKVINLCESVEGAILTMPGRMSHTYPVGVRQKMFGNINYLEQTHDIAEVPYDFAPRFYPSPSENEWADIGEKMCRDKKRPILIWCTTGSSPHKTYPFTQVVLAWLLKKTPVEVFLYGGHDPISKELGEAVLMNLREDGCDMSRVHDIAGKWSIRQALTFAQRCDVMVGPETGPLNAICMDENQKIIYLSHSSHENLTKHWKKTTVLEPDRDFCPCFPCHRLHHDWQFCHQDERTKAALCAAGVAPERLFKEIVRAILPKDAPTQPPEVEAAA